MNYLILLVISTMCRLMLIVSVVVCCIGSINSSASYKHVIFMHGILSGPSEVDDLSKWIQKAHPGTNVTSIDLFNNIDSLQPMWKQVEHIKEEVQQLLTNKSEGTNLICYSQGGLICRGLLSVLDHNVESFIALSSPLMGQYGDTNYLKFLFPNFIKSEIYKYFYTKSGQKWSVADYWNDPHHQDLYEKSSTYLAVLNNQTYNSKSQEFKANFMKLKNLVLVGGPDDGVITPWQSSQFGYYNDKETVVAMRQQPWYTEDWFGLKTLDSRKAIHIFTIPGVKHVHWYNTKSVYDKCILPFLN